MTITSTVTAIQSPGNGSATVFAAPMKIFAATDLIVGFIVAGVYIQQTSGYNVTNIDLNGGCTVTFTIPPPLGTTVDIRTDTPETQGTEFANLGSYLPESTTDTCDRIVRMVQDLSRQTYDYGIHGPDTESVPWTPLPGAANRAGGALIFDANGLPIIGVPVTGTISGPLVVSLLTQDLIGGVIYPASNAENSISAVIVNHGYPYGHVYRYGTNAIPGTTDITAAINTCANVCRQGSYTLQLPADILLVSNSVNFSSITVQGLGEGLAGSAYIIRSAGSSFDIVTSTGGTVLKDMRVDGANPGATGGLTGDNISFKAVSPAHPYLNTLINVASTNARARCIYIERGGYTSFFHVQCLGAGLHALECFGTNVDECTTIRDYGSSQFGSCPNGFGIKLTECVSMAFHDSIIESTQGIQLNGGDNRALTFDGVYQEVTAGGNFITDNGSAGVGLTVRSCFGGNTNIPFLTNWQDVYFQGNSNLQENSPPLANRAQVADSGQLVTSTTSGVSVTVLNKSLTPGLWMVWATVQSQASTATTLTQAACCLTQTVTDSGLQNSTSSFFQAAAQANYNPGASMDQRLNCFELLQVTTTTNLYLRAFFNFSGAGNLTYRGYMTAIKVQ